MKPLHIAILFLALILCVYLFPLGSYGSGVFYVSAAFFAMAAVFSAGKGGFRQSLKNLGLLCNRRELPHLAILGIAALLTLLVAAGAISAVMYLAGMLDTSGVYDKVALLPLPALIAAFTIAPLGEEAFFRGYLFRQGAQFLEKRRFLSIPPWIASAVLSSIIFALLHYSYGSAAEILVAFSVGALLCAFTRKANSLVPAVVAHALFNLLSLAFTVFA